MSAVARKLGGFTAALVAVFGAALALGTLAGPAVGAPTAPAAEAAAHEEAGTHTMTPEPAAPAEIGHEGGHAIPGGLAVSQDGYTLTPAHTLLPLGQEQEFRFTVSGPDGLPVRDYVREHDKELHLIVVRRDLSGFQHVHPTREPDGTWTVPLTLAEAGAYRAFADFVPAGGPDLTLGVDLHVAGDHAPRPLPEPARTAEVDGYRVDLAGDLTAGTSSELTLTVSRGGEPVTDLEPYLGAYGHLVALRAGDLAYLHVHPDASTASGPSSPAPAVGPDHEPGDGETQAGPAMAFVAEVPTPGTYRLYLDFQHGGVVRTAEFTVATAGAGAAHAHEDGA